MEPDRSIQAQGEVDSMSDPQSEFLKQVEEDLHTARRVVARYRRKYRRLVIGGVVSGSVAAALTGSVAVGGPALADAMGGWRIVCSLAAVFAATAAALTGIQERMRTPEHVAQADACVAQLTALRFALRTNVTDLDAHQDEYREILRKYTRYLSET
jgi:hypothetical protein